MIFKQLRDKPPIPVTKPEARLKQVQEKLDAAANVLVGIGLQNVPGNPGGLPDPNACRRLLQEAATLLAEVRRTDETQPAAALLSLTQGVGERSRRIQLLLDAAAAFYRGWLSATPLPAADYTPPGVWVSASGPSRLVLEA